MGITALVTTSVNTDILLSSGKIRLNSRCRTNGSPPTSETGIGLCLRTRSSTPSTSSFPRLSFRLRSVTPPVGRGSPLVYHPGQLSGHSRVISIESRGTLPVRIRPQEVRISRGVILGLIVVEDIYQE